VRLRLLIRAAAAALVFAVLAAGPLIATAQTTAPAPNARSKPLRYERFIVADYIISPKVYNEFSPGNSGTGGSWSVRAAIELPAFGLPWILAADYRSYSYPHYSGISPAQFAAAFDGNPCPHGGLPASFTPAAGDQGCVTAIGAFGQFAVPSFAARDTDYGGRLGLRVAQPRIYVEVGYLHREENYGYPKQDGYGFGTEKLPDLDRTVSVYGSMWYYPSVSGNFGYPPGAPPALVRTTGKFRQRVLKYQLGGTLHLRNSRFFVDAGVLGDAVAGANLSPSNASHAGVYVGLGVGPRTP
jgi:hypothetical protein